MPVDKDLEVIREKLDEDQTLRDRTPFRSRQHHPAVEFVLEVYILPFSRRVLPADSRGSYGVACVTYSL